MMLQSRLRESYSVLCCWLTKPIIYLPLGARQDAFCFPCVQMLAFH